MEVTMSSGLFSRRRNVFNQKPGRMDEMLENKEVHSNHLTTLKITPTYFPAMGKQRPVQIACRSCVLSSGMIVPERNRLLGIRNCFLVENMNMEQPFYRRCLPHVLHYWGFGDKKSKRYCFVEPSDVIADPSLFKLILGKESTIEQKKMTEMNRNVLTEERNRAYSFLESFGLSPLGKWGRRVFRRLGWWLLGKVLSIMFKSIAIHKSEIGILHELHYHDLPIIYLPLNRSHFDSLILSWTLVSCGFPPPLFIGSHSLMQKSPLRNIARIFGGLGCMNNRKGTEIDYKYPIFSSCLLTYFSVILKRGNSLQFVLEPNRSRNGLPSTLVVGVELLNILAELHEKKDIEDVYIIPLSINYEIVPDADILSKSDPSSTETSFFKQLWKFLTSKQLGHVRVSISQPFRLREFKQGVTVPNISKWSYKDEYPDMDIKVSDTSCILLNGEDIHWDDDRESCASVSSVYGETDLLRLRGESPQDRLVQALAHHCIYDAMRSTVFMSTNIVSFLMLYKFTSGTSLDRIAGEMGLLKKYFKNHHMDVGFSGNLRAVVRSAIKLLGPSVIATETLNGVQIYKPVKTDMSLATLNYYSNHVTQVFAMQSAIATAILAYCGPAYHADKLSHMKRHMEEEDLVQRAMQICQILKGEFTFFPLCKSTEEVVRDTIEVMKETSLVEVSMRKVYYETESDGILPWQDGEGVCTVQRIEIRGSLSSFGKLEVLRNLTRPILELYSFICNPLKCLLPTGKFKGELDEVKLRQIILPYIEKKIQQGLISNVGLAKMQVIRNTLSNLISMDVLGYDCPKGDPKTHIYYLCDFYNTEEALDELSDHIRGFCTY